MSFGSSFGNPLNRLMSSVPATLAKGVDRPVDVIGANGPTGTAVIPESDDSESDDDLPIALSFDQEQHLLLRMNEQQGKTIGELQARIAALEKELIEKPVAPVCYIKCSHCKDEDIQ